MLSNFPHSGYKQKPFSVPHVQDKTLPVTIPIPPPPKTPQNVPDQTMETLTYRLPQAHNDQLGHLSTNIQAASTSSDGGFEPAVTVPAPSSTTVIDHVVQQDHGQSDQSMTPLPEPLPYTDPVHTSGSDSTLGAGCSGSQEAVGGRTRDRFGKYEPGDAN